MISFTKYQSSKPYIFRRNKMFFLYVYNENIRPGSLLDNTLNNLGTGRSTTQCFFIFGNLRPTPEVG
jgi:hypothetical protein